MQGNVDDSWTDTWDSNLYVGERREKITVCHQCLCQFLSALGIVNAKREFLFVFKVEEYFTVRVCNRLNMTADIFWHQVQVHIEWLMTDLLKWNHEVEWHLLFSKKHPMFTCIYSFSGIKHSGYGCTHAHTCTKHLGRAVPKAQTVSYHWLKSIPSRTCCSYSHLYQS